MKLPHADKAMVDSIKIREYCLNPLHPHGKHKARVFASVLGITAEGAEYLRDMFLAAACTNDVLVGKQDSYGQRYTLDLVVDGPTDSAVVRSAWIIRTGEDIPRLTSCYVLLRSSLCS